MTKTLSRKKAGRRAFEANILDGLADAVILIDNNRTFVDGNEAAMNLLGANVQGQDLADVVDNAEVIEAVDKSGRMLPRELCCTGLAGLSITPTSKKIEEMLNKKQ